MTQNKTEKKVTDYRETIKSFDMLLANGLIDHVKSAMSALVDFPYRISDDGKHMVEIVAGASAWLDKFVTQDVSCLELKRRATILSKLDDEVLITGETGVGKELIARSMIGNRTGKFVRINCAAMPEHLIEAELFGYVRGAFTGAERNKTGLIKEAEDGVMFLDEIGDLPLSLQGKLLNVLQRVSGKRFIRPVGGVDEVEINCRFVFATHRELNNMCNNGTFRLDLFARISTFELNVPSLVYRTKDIPLIIRHLAKENNMIDAGEKLIEKNYAKQPCMYMPTTNVRGLEQQLKRMHVFGEL